MRSVVVTGVSTGIGNATAKVLVARGFRVFGSVRTTDDAERVAGEIGAGFTPLVFDVTDAAAVRAAADTVRAALGGETLAGLVNNAGMAVPGAVLELSPDDFRRQLEVNLIGPLVVTQAFAPLIGTDTRQEGPPGRIVMIGSLAGVRGDPFMGAYVASKHALEGLSETLRRELMLFGIDVILIGPGPIKTPIWAKAEAADIAADRSSPWHASLVRAREMSRELERIGLPPERVGELVHTALTTARPKVRYAIVPDPVKTWFSANLPKRLVDRITARMLAIEPPARKR
ncbi:MAG: SDR family NAD(P)-dependent oxidoreductase [Hyphomicrobiaceae bacterium]